jgi:acid stress chaperone HdeB
MKFARGEIKMRKFAIFAILMMAGAAIPVNAAVMVEMSLITCKQYQEMVKSEPDKAAIVAAWMGGYFSASKDLSTVDLRYTKRNTDKVMKYCKSHRDETLMSAVQKNFR